MILLSAGHYPKEPGACFPDENRTWCEHEEATHWVTIIALYIRQQMGVAVVPSSWLGDKVKWINTYRPVPVLVAEVHFNSDISKKQKGCETLYCPRSKKGQAAAQIVQNAMSSIFPPSRGIKEGWYRQDSPGHVDYPGDVEGDEKVDYFLAKTKPVSLIIEPEFIYNRGVIEGVRDIGCEIIAKGLLDAVAALEQL